MGKPTIKKEYYYLLLKAGIAYEGFVDLGDGRVALAYNKLDIIRVDYNKYDDHFLSIKYTPVLIITKNDTSKNDTPKNDDYYKVKQGDTLSSVALKHSVTVNELMNWNKINDKNKIEAGQTLIIRKAENIPKVKNTSNKNIFDNEVMETTSILFSAISTVSSAILELNNFSYLSSLAKNNKFLAVNQYGILSEMHDGYLTTKRMIKNILPQKLAFEKNLNRLRWVKYGGNALGIFTTAGSGWSFLKNPNWEDGISTGVGITSLLYWEVGAAYGAGRLYLDLSAEQFKMQEEAKKKLDSKTSFWISVWNGLAYYPGRY